MTEPVIRELLMVLESERDGRLAHARAAEDIAATLDLVRNDMADWLLAAHKGVPIPKEAIENVRARLANISDAIERVGSESAQSCAALTRRLPPKPVVTEPGQPAPVDELADTRDMDLDEIAAVGEKD